jgi:hypothetical protein
MTLANMRANGVRSLLGTCESRIKIEFSSLNGNLMVPAADPPIS